MNWIKLPPKLKSANKVLTSSQEWSYNYLQISFLYQQTMNGTSKQAALSRELGNGENLARCIC